MSCFCHVGLLSAQLRKPGTSMSLGFINLRLKVWCSGFSVYGVVLGSVALLTLEELLT